MASVALNTMPPWPESSPNRRNVNAMSFYDALMYDSSTPYDAPDPYGAPDPYDAPNAYENTLASLLDTDFPLPASPSRRGVLSSSQRGVLSPSQRGVLSPSRRGVLSPSRRRALSRSSSSKSVFGDSTNIFIDSANVFNGSTNTIGISTNISNDSTNIFADSTNVFADRMDADAAGSSGDSGENLFIDPKYAPSDRTESVDELTESCGDLTESTSDLTESSDEIDAADALETVSSLPGTSGIVFGGTTFATDLATFMTLSMYTTLPTYTTFPKFPAMTDEPPALAIAPEGSIDKRPGEMHAPESERAGEDQEAVERANDDQEAVERAGDDREVADAQGAHAARVDAERADKEDQHGIAGRSLTEIMSQFYPIPPGLLLEEPSFAFLPPFTTTDAPLPPSRAQSPASAIEFITRPYSFATDPAPSDPHSQIELATTQQATAAQDGLVAGVQNNGGAENNGVGNNGGARAGSVAEGARDGAAEGAQLTSPATTPATILENNQTKPHRKARKSKGKGKVAVEHAIAPRAMANKTAAQPAPHAPAAVLASHSVVTPARSAAPTSHSDVPEYAEVIEQQRQAKKARKARGTKGRAAVDSAVNAAVGIAASAPVPAARSPTAVLLSAQRTARAQEPAAAQSVAHASAAIGSAAAGAAHASREAQGKPPASKSQQVLETSGVAAPPTASMAMSSSMPAPAQAMGMAATSMTPRVPSALHHGHAFPAAAPEAASFAPQPSLPNGSMGASISSRLPAPPIHASSGSSTGSMLWQALMKGELTMEEMQARLRSNVKSPPALEGARADVLRSVTLSEGPPVAPPSFRSPGIGIKRKHGHDAELEDPNRKQCGWTHFDAQNKPMGPCTHFFNKKSDRETLKKNVRDHMRAMEPNRCDAIYCQWAHDCKRHNRYFSDFYAAVEHIVDIILGTETRVRR
ncbi:hypothetical protein EV714DRAFT_239325 [Schizophyllum commune]